MAGEDSGREGINKLCHFRDVIIEFGWRKLFGKQLKKINRGNSLFHWLWTWLVLSGGGWFVVRKQKARTMIRIRHNHDDILAAGWADCATIPIVPKYGILRGLVANDTPSQATSKSQRVTMLWCSLPLGLPGVEIEMFFFLSLLFSFFFFFSSRQRNKQNCHAISFTCLVAGCLRGVCPIRSVVGGRDKPTTEGLTPHHDPRKGNLVKTSVALVARRQWNNKKK